MFGSSTGTVGGMRVLVSNHAMEETSERMFPESKNRSKRIYKKLVKRFGGEFRKRPCIWKTPAGIVCHPAMYAKLVQQLNNQ
jgi:predicted SpoU family rRNA methylase